jgi:hypothetical protein
LGRVSCRRIENTKFVGIVTLASLGLGINRGGIRQMRRGLFGEMLAE